MKKVIISRFACGVMMGLVAPLSAVSAADANDYIQAQIGGDGVVQADQSPSWSVSQGPQGPIRTDFMDGRSAAGEPYAYAEDAPADRFAYSEDAPVSSVTSVGTNGP